MRILFLTLYPEIIASSRYRVYQYLPYLKSRGINFDVHSAVPSVMFKYLYNTGNIFGNIAYTLSEIATRTCQLLRAGLYDVVFLQKSLTTTNFKWLPELLNKKKVIFDLDDNVFQQEISAFSSGSLRKFQDNNQVLHLTKQSNAVTAGNKFLYDLVYPHNKNTFVFPTPVDTDRFVPNTTQKKQTKTLSIGWIGNTYTARFLKLFTNVFKELQKKYPVKVGIICDARAHLEGVDCYFKKWNYETEVENLQNFDIGIMPMPDSDWTRGKCGFKALQYMSCGIPTICSPVGVNSEIITDGVNGLLASTEEEWIDRLSLLIENPDLRKQLGQAGQETVEQKYSLRVNAPKLKRIIESVCG